MTNMHLMIDVTIGMLTRMNENPDLYPLLLVFFTNYTGHFPETELTKQLSLATRKITLSTLLCRIFKRWSLEEKAVFVFDDIQWVDSVSIEILSHIFLIGIENGVPSYDNIFLLFCSRPLKDLDGSDVNKILESPSITHLFLKGLQEQDLHEYLCSSFPADSITNISADITELLLEKTAHSPLALQMMVEAIKRNDLFRIDDRTLLFTSGSAEEVAKLLEKSLSHTIILQFDRLHPDFQRFLRHASIYGQYFTLSDVNRIMVGWTLGALERLLNSEDKFSFLRPGDNGVFEQYSFRHISITNAIYDSLSYSEKLSLHFNVAKLLEEKLTGSSNREALLPSLHHHYWLTSSVEKRIAYAEELGLLMDSMICRLLYEKMNFNKEATVILQQLVQYVDSIQDVPSPYNRKEHQAVWHATLSTAASQNFRVHIALPSGVKALHLLGVSFPHPETCTSKEVIRRLIRQLRLLMATKGGKKITRTRKRNNLRVVPGSLTPARHVWVDKALQALFWITIPTQLKTISAEFKLVVFLELLNQSILVRDIAPSIWVEAALTAAYIFLVPFPRFSRIYLDAAKKAITRCEIDSWARSAKTLYAVLTASKDESELKEYFEKFTSLAERKGDPTDIQMQKNFSLYFDCPKSFDITESIIVAGCEGLWGQSGFLQIDSLTQMIHAAVISKRLEKIDFYLARLKQFEDNENRMLRLMGTGEQTHLGEGPLAVAQVWWSIFKQDIAGAVEGFERIFEIIRPIRFVVSIIFPAQTAFLGIWPTLTLLDQNLEAQTITRAHFNQTRKRLLTTFINSKPTFAAFAKGMHRSQMFFHNFCAALAVLKGNRKMAIRSLKLLVEPDMAFYLRTRMPVILGASFAALSLLGVTGTREKAIDVLLEYEGKALLDWLNSAKPFKVFLSVHCKQ
ncbi:hypothetical protein BC829DRAFT_44933 [Chytridium lagenaria]|nr:hypothetical protein BC829DRAFT_44933 [Chytridium lagenaria]